MRYPIAVEPGADATAWGVVVPDLPTRLHSLGCLAAAIWMLGWMIPLPPASLFGVVV